MEKKIRVAVIGCGGRGMHSYAPYVKDFEGVEIVAAAEPIRETGIFRPNIRPSSRSVF